MALMFIHQRAWFWDRSCFGDLMEFVLRVLQECSEFIEPELRPYWDGQVAELAAKDRPIYLDQVGQARRDFSAVFAMRTGFVLAHRFDQTLVGVEVCLMRRNLTQAPTPHRPEGSIERILFDFQHKDADRSGYSFDVIVSGLGDAPRLVLQRAFEADARCQIFRSSDNPSAKRLYGGLASELGLPNAPIYQDNKG